MKIEVTITPDQLANLFTSAIEGGDPVTTASRGGWCSGIFWKSKRHNPPRGKDGTPWYADASQYEGDFLLEVREFHEETGKETPHKLDPAKVEAGFAAMIKKYGHIWQQIEDDNIDAPCADIFLQCCLFGEEKYA